MSNIRVTYSGLIALVVGLISVLTGIVFTLIVTRRLSPEEFGMWSIIGSMISYFLIAEPVISYWSTRQIARGEEVGKTSIITSSAFSLCTIPLYLILVFFVSNTSSINSDSMILAAILIPASFVSQTLTGINLGHKPHATSYGLLGFESLKIPVGLIFVYFLDLGVNGAIITTLIAYIAKITILLYFGRTRLKSKFNITVLRRWLKLSWIPLYSNVSHVLWSLDVVLYSVITGSVIGVAYYSASLAIAAIIGHAGLISQALYPKLLTKESRDFVKENFTRLMYFALPILGISIVFSKPGLFALNPAYEDASMIVILLAFRTFFYVVTGVLYQILLGMEKIDIEQNPTYVGLAKSKLFTVPTLNTIHYALYIVTLTVILAVLNSSNISELDLVTWWSTVSFILQIPFLIYAWILVQKNIKFSIPYENILKYTVATISFAIVFFLTSESIVNYEPSIYNFLPSLILQLGICIGVYLLITYVIDKKTRMLFKSILSEFK